MNANHTEGQGQLIKEVINRGICVTCGACVGLCPYFQYFDGKVVTLDQCHSDTWRCLQVCPRADFEGTALDGFLSDDGNPLPVGPYRKIVIARSRSKEVREKAQYGGVVSVLLIHALEQGLVTSAILTDRGNGISPSGRIARDRQAVMDCAGSRYSASGSLAALNAAIKNNEEGLGMVGLPCQMEALAKIKKTDPDGRERSGRIRLKVGLFCTWALDYRKLSDFLESLNIGDPIQKYDIPPPPAQIFQVMSGGDWRDVPLDDVRPFIQKGCTLCQDMTAEWADLSVGTVEGMKEWNTVIIRTEIGLNLVETARKEGILEIDDLPEENLNHLKEASLNKKRRGHDAKEALRQEEE